MNVSVQLVGTIRLHSCDMYSWICVCFILTVQTSKAEHSNLLGDVVPGSWSPQSLQLGLQLIPHEQNPVRHGLHITLPTMGTHEGVGRRIQKETQQ